MKKSTILLYIFFLLFSSVNIAHSQILFKPGYVVHLNSDTVYGRIYDGGEIANSKTCRFKSFEKGKIESFKPEDIRSYRIEHIKSYKSEVDKKGNRQFMEVLLDGEIELFYQWNGRKTSYYVRKKGKKLVPLFNDYVQIRPKSSFINAQITTTKTYYQNIELYKDSLYFVFDSCKAIMAELFELDYDQKSLVNISRNYLSECSIKPLDINYEKNFSIVRDRIGFYSGITESEYTVTIPEETNMSGEVISPAFEVIAPVTSVPIGIFLSIPLKRFSDRIFFQPEIIYTRSDYSSSISTITGPKELSINKQTLKAPLLLKYQLPIAKFKPSIAVGWEIRYILNLDVPIAEVDVVRHLEPGRWVAQAEVAYPISKKTDVFARVKFFGNQKKKKELDVYERESPYDPYYDKAKIKASFHVGIMF